MVEKHEDIRVVIVVVKVIRLCCRADIKGNVSNSGHDICQ